ncbi:MAG TPA: lytic transglycosylase domain-containing protein [Arenimonas sp.]|nr:lytic transglycosylase domain-containing protein [Arenimonas sp.]
MLLRCALALLLAAATVPAEAGVLYRCDGSDGVRSYGNRQVPGAKCTVVSRYTSTPGKTAAAASAPVSPAKTAPAAPAKGKVDFRSAPAGAVVSAPARGGGARVTRGAVYKYEKNGVTHYTNVPPPKAAQATLLFSYIETCYACGSLPGVDFSRVALNTEAFGAEIRQAAREFGVEEALVRAVIHAESAYRPNAVSNKGAQGLMQLIPATASRFGVADPFDPVQNIRGGVQYLSWLLKRYSDNTTLAAAAYNAGEGAVDRHGGVPPYDETQRYVQRVGQLADRYRGALAAN